MKTLIVTKPEDLVVFGSSMEYDDPPDQIRTDVDQVFTAVPDDPPDLGYWTETESAKMRNAIRTGAARHHHVSQFGGGVGFSLHNKHELLEIHDHHVLDPKPAPFPHGARSLYGPTFRTPAGNIVTALFGHWTTADRGPVKWNDMTASLVDLVERYSLGRRVVLWGGDTNRRDTRTPDAFTLNGMTTFWDAVGRYPDTYGKVTDDGKPIDILGIVNADRRVTVTRAYAGGRKRRNSDHRWVRGRIHIEPTGGLK